MLLEARHVSKSFGPVQALHDVDFEVDRGEVVALVGDNGAGKSTLIKAIAGVQPPDSGEFFIDGRRVSIKTPADATGLGIATVYQDLALCDNLDVVANLFLGREPLEGHGWRRLYEPVMERRTIELLGSLGVTTLGNVRARVGTLSGGQRQAIAIARAMVGQPRIIVYDEPTAALGITQTGQVLQLIHHLRDQGMGVVVISHNLANVFNVADRIVVLRLGRRTAAFERRSTSHEEVVSAITGASAEVIARLGAREPALA